MIIITLVETPKFPLSAYADTHVFKIFLLDVGLLGAQSSLSLRTIIEGDQLFMEFKGALTESFVAQKLKAATQQELYYWTSADTAKMDFLLQTDHAIYPLEVKAGESRKKKSLGVFGEKYAPKALYHTTLMSLKADGATTNFPLYMMSLIPEHKVGAP